MSCFRQHDREEIAHSYRQRLVAASDGASLPGKARCGGGRLFPSRQSPPPEFSQARKERHFVFQRPRRDAWTFPVSITAMRNAERTRRGQQSRAGATSKFDDSRLPL